MTDEEKFTQARAAVIGALGQAFALYGLPDVVGRIYGLLYTREEPLGLEEIAGELGVSKATVSINVRLLEEFKFVHKLWQKGSRRDYYTAQRNFTRAFMEVLQTNLEKELTITGEAFARSRGLLAGMSAAPDSGLSRRADFFGRQLSELDRQYRNYGRLARLLGLGERLWKTVTFKRAEQAKNSSGS